MKLYHWRIAVLNFHHEEQVFNFLTMAEDAEAAREILKPQVLAASVPMASQQALYVGLSGNPTFVAEPGYPITIW